MARILVIDDEEGMREMLRKMLEREGHQLHMASNGEEGVSAALAIKPDLVITDIIMPRADGVDVVVQLRKQLLNCPILAISGGARAITPQFSLESALIVGCNETLSKPFSRQQLLDKVKALLGG